MELVQWRRQHKEQLVQNEREGTNSAGSCGERKQRILFSIGRRQYMRKLNKAQGQERDWAAGRLSHVQEIPCSEALLLLAGYCSLFIRKHEGKQRGTTVAAEDFGPFAVLKQM